MFRMISVTIFAVLIMIPHSAIGTTDSWESFKQLLDRHYFFENKDVERVTCRVVLPSLDPVRVREQLKPLGDKVLLDENLLDFRVTYSRKNGITFIVPHFKAVLISSEGAADLKRVESGIKMINDGAQMQIQGAMDVIKVTLDDFVPPKKESLTELEVFSAEGKTTVKYKKEGASYSEVYSANTKVTVTKTSGSEINATEEFMELDGKLALAKGTMRLREGENTIDMTIAVQYQDLGKLFFPSVLEQQVQMSGPSFKQEGQVNIGFSNCQAE